MTPVTHKSLAAEISRLADWLAADPARCAVGAEQLQEWSAAVAALGAHLNTLTRWERVYAAAFARIMLQQKEPDLHDERVLARAKALAERIADGGAKR
jgi:hypothetical protein